MKLWIVKWIRSKYKWHGDTFFFMRIRTNEIKLSWSPQYDVARIHRHQITPNTIKFILSHEKRNKVVFINNYLIVFIQLRQLVRHMITFSW
jgi:hypothetical protein